jgi:hypothetical protein
LQRCDSQAWKRLPAQTRHLLACSYIRPRFIRSRLESLMPWSQWVIRLSGVLPLVVCFHCHVAETQSQQSSLANIAGVSWEKSRFSLWIYCSRLDVIYVYDTGLKKNTWAFFHYLLKVLHRKVQPVKTSCAFGWDFPSKHERSFPHWWFYLYQAWER